MMYPGKTCEEVLLMVPKDDDEAPKVTITEKGEKAEELSSRRKMGYRIDEMELLGSIQSCMRDQTYRPDFQPDGRKMSLRWTCRLSMMMRPSRKLFPPQILLQSV